MLEFSVLMSIYYKETASNLSECFESLANQMLPAVEIIVVKDGTLAPELEECLADWQSRLPLKIVGYEENRGLAYALNYGIPFCSYELVARMDSDDVCVPHRFEKQVSYFNENKNVVLLSGYIDEFNCHPGDIDSIKKVPIGYVNIIKYLKKRNAFNHMAVMFRKEPVISVGGYLGIDGFEDYDLWIRLYQAGYIVENLNEVLVHARIGNNMIGRRSGIKYARKEIVFLYRQKQAHFISTVEFIVLLLCRVPIRLLPLNVLSFIYLKFLR
jgi:glycosyltransferase involved in cell wall biosynthesis